MWIKKKKILHFEILKVRRQCDKVLDNVNEPHSEKLCFTQFNKGVAGWLL